MLFGLGSPPPTHNKPSFLFSLFIWEGDGGGTGGWEENGGKRGRNGGGMEENGDRNGEMEINERTWPFGGLFLSLSDFPAIFSWWREEGLSMGVVVRWERG